MTTSIVLGRERLTTSNEDFCPSPPSLSVSEVASGMPSGILTSTSTFVAQQILVVSDRDPVVFFRRYLAGFSFTAPDPTYSVCNCQQLPDGEEAGACGFLDLLNECDGDSNCTIYSERDCPGDTMSLCDRTSNDGCYVVDGFSADSVQVGLVAWCPSLSYLQ